MDPERIVVRAAMEVAPAMLTDADAFGVMAHSLLETARHRIAGGAEGRAYTFQSIRLTVLPDLETFTRDKMIAQILVTVDVAEAQMTPHPLDMPGTKISVCVPGMRHVEVARFVPQEATADIDAALQAALAGDTGPTFTTDIVTLAPVHLASRGLVFAGYYAPTDTWFYADT